MLNSFVPLVVRRYLGSRRGFTRVVTIFSVLGILLGVAALIIVLAVMSGFRQELMGRILGVSGHATLQVEELQAEPARRLAAELEQIEGIVKATPYVSGQVMVTAEGRATGAFLRGVDGDPLANMGKTVDVVGDNLGTENQLLVGSGLASQLGLMPGSGVTLLSPEGNRTVMGFMPRTGQFGVAGTFNVGMVQFDNALVLGRLADVQSFLGRKDSVDALEIRLEDAELINKLVPQILEIADDYAESPMDVSITPWTVANAEFFRALQVERVTMFIILSLIVVVAAFNIITGQMMLVNDKMGDIAILRTMGATQGQIRRIFLYNGLMLGVIGVAGGILLGMLIVWRMADVVDGIKALTGINLFPSEVYFLSELPGRINATDMLNVVGMAMVLTVLASLYPAWRASKFNPVELLRRG